MAMLQNATFQTEDSHSSKGFAEDHNNGLYITFSLAQYWLSLLIG